MIRAAANLFNVAALSRQGARSLSTVGMPPVGNQQATADSHKLPELDLRRRQLMYRAKMRGWLEMDVILGNWAAKHVPTASDSEMDQFQDVLDIENPDLFAWFTKQKPIPEEVLSPVMKSILKDIDFEKLNKKPAKMA